MTNSPHGVRLWVCSSKAKQGESFLIVEKREGGGWVIDFPPGRKRWQRLTVFLCWKQLAFFYFFSYRYTCSWFTRSRLVKGLARDCCWLVSHVAEPSVLGAFSLLCSSFLVALHREGLGVEQRRRNVWKHQISLYHQTCLNWTRLLWLLWDPLPRKLINACF